MNTQPDQSGDAYQIYRRLATLAILALIIVAGLSVGVSGIVLGRSAVSNSASLITVVICGALFFTAWRWPATTPWVSYVAMIFITLITGASVVFDPVSSTEFAPSILIPTVLALIIGNTGWVAGAGLGTLAFPLIALPNSPYTGATRLPILLLIIGGITVGRFLLERARKDMRAAQAQAHEQSRHLHEQTAILEEKNAQLQQRSDELSRLLDMVSTLEVPILHLREDVLMLPLVGHVDTRRMSAARDRLLHVVSTKRARLAIIDVAGVAIVDTSVLRELLQTATAVRLLGANTVISGFSASVASSVMALGVDISQITTVRDIEEALATYV